jgi:hypothetical protein
MNIFANLPRLFRVFFIVGTIALSQSAHALDWNWGWRGNSVKGSGIAKTESRNISGFSGISVAIPANVTIVQGETEGVSLEGDDNILPLIETVVEDRELQIRFKEKNLSVKTSILKLTVNAKTVEALSVAGSGDMHAASLRAATLKVKISGSGNAIIGNLAAESLIVSIAGSGNFTAGGKARNVETRIAGSGDMKIGKLEANKVKVAVAGSGDATVWARESLNVSVAGSGDVKYYGDAKVSQSVAGSGSVKRLGTTP